MAWPNTVRKKDLRIQFYRGKGKGGQNKNKRDTACRITHIPTGIAATAEEHRTQGRNKTTAFRRLAKRLAPIMKGQKQVVIDSETGERVRTYHTKRHEVVDHRIPKRKFDLQQTLGGDLDPIIKELMNADT